MFEKDQKVSKEEYTKVAIWCNSNGHYIEEVNGEYFIRQIAPPTEEEIAAEELAKAKAERAEYVAKLVVTVDNLQFDGDETSQDRMARSIVALNDGETVQWVLADNTIAQVTKEQLRQALRLAGEAQTAIWANPYLNTEKETIEE